MMKRNLAGSGILLVALFLCLTGMAQAQQVYSIVNKDTLAVGDTLQYVIVTKQNPNVDSILFPDSASFGKWFGIKDRKIYKSSVNSDSAVYTLQFFGVRDTTIQAQHVGFVTGKDTVVKATMPFPVHFRSQIADTANAQFKPLKPIYLFALSILPYIVGLLLLMVIAYILYRMYQRWYKQREEIPEIEAAPRIFEDPLEILELDLNRLANDESLKKREFKIFYSRLGDIVRAYFERLYKIPALESTTRELHIDLDRLGVDNELKKYTRDLLRQADMVKFAKFRPTLDQAQSDLRGGIKFLERARSVDKHRVEQQKIEFEEAVRREHEKAETEQKMDDEKTQDEGGEEIVDEPETK